ncbi:MAG: hypothetical protein NZ961_08560, partial [Candidatus Poribacteria bacterium]|nr:hypothetical protein [Candidatus Poribacteria bacterium]
KVGWPLNKLWDFFTNHHHVQDILTKAQPQRFPQQEYVVINSTDHSVNGIPTTSHGINSWRHLNNTFSVRQRINHFLQSISERGDIVRFKRFCVGLFMNLTFP